MIIIVSILVGLAAVTIALRMLARLKSRLRIQADDYLCSTALMLREACTAGRACSPYVSSPFAIKTARFQSGCVIAGNGAHFDQPDNETWINFRKVTFLTNW